MTGTIHNLKGGVGPFKIYNIGKMAYSVERNGRVLSRTNHISDAYRDAEHFYEQERRLSRGDNQ